MKQLSSLKIKIEPPYDPAIPLLSIYPNKVKLAHQKHTCMLMFITALLTIVKM